MENNNKIVVVGIRCQATNVLYHSLAASFELDGVIIEQPISKVELLKRRIKKLGLSKVIGQAAFQLTIVPYLRHVSRERIEELEREFGFCGAQIPEPHIIDVSSVNAPETIDILRRLNPRVVIVSGTRIISHKVLNSVDSIFINMHAGITPLYRGVHGAYWALAEDNKRACGVTVHLVDKGIDTGTILEQGIIQPREEDNFVTYPLLQLGIGMPLLKKCINDVLEDRVQMKSYPPGESKLRTHPTIAEYLHYRIVHGVR